MKNLYNQKAGVIKTTDGKGIVFSKRVVFIVEDIIIGLYVLLFLYSGSSKLLEYENTELGMSKSPIISEFASTLVWLVPLIEFVISTSLLIPKTVLIGLYASSMLMIIFTAYIIFILNYSSFIPCSCGGAIASLTWNQHLVLNIIYIILGIIAITFKTENK
jgi:uncharacterized membrane protein YphA (DoxX/SURF4 family)